MEMREGCLKVLRDVVEQSGSVLVVKLYDRHWAQSVDSIAEWLKQMRYVKYTHTKHENRGGGRARWRREGRRKRTNYYKVTELGRQALGLQ